MRRCACCRMPAPLAALHPGDIRGVGVLIGLCARCNQAHDRLPHGTTQKRLNAAARLAAADTTRTFWTARFPDAAAAKLAAHMLGHHDTALKAAAALGWREIPEFR